MQCADCSAGVKLLRAQELLKRPHLAKAIDEMGRRSALAQALPNPITSLARLVPSDHRLYVAMGNQSVRGILRVGEKQLFVRQKPNAPYVCLDALLCVLDFYVHEDCQRTGVGLSLFEEMCRQEKGAQQGAHRLAFDRPSPKFISFLSKHYRLSSYVPQDNRFVIFDQFWDAAARPTRPSHKVVLKSEPVPIRRELEPEPARRSKRQPERRPDAALTSSASATRPAATGILRPDQQALRNDPAAASHVRPAHGTTRGVDTISSKLTAVNFGAPLGQRRAFLGAKH